MLANGLSFLDPKSIGKALKLWRKSKGMRQKDVAREASKFEHGHGFSYERLVTEILPAYGIRDIGDFDLFIDYCRDHSIDDVIVVKHTSKLVHEKQGTEETLVSPDDVGSNRSRISKIRIIKSTRWQQHEGHEFVLVSAGRVRADFALNNADEKRKSFELGAGECLAFPSVIFHSFTNIGTEAAEIIVARPTKSLPKGMMDK